MMENRINDCEISKLECILKCTDSKVFFRFPHEDKSLKMWLNKLGLADFPKSVPLPRICNNHFSDDMFEAGGKRLKLTAIPVLRTSSSENDIASTPDFTRTLKRLTSELQSKPKIFKILERNPKHESPVIPEVNVVKEPLQTMAPMSPAPVNPPASSEEIKKPSEERPKEKVIKTTEKKKTRVHVRRVDPRVKARTQHLLNTILAPMKDLKNETPNKPPPIIKSTPTIDTAVHQTKSMPRDKALPGQKKEIVITRYSKCFLKCRDVKSTYQFPQHEPSRKLWFKAIGLKHMPPRSSAARICSNHFSPRMFANPKSIRLTRCAIPDINLPGQTIFAPEEGSEDGDYWPSDVFLEPNTLVEDIPEKTKSPSPSPPPTPNSKYFRAMLNPPFPVEDHPDILQPEILINPIENLKTVVNKPNSKEGILHVFQPAVAKKPEDDNKIVVPDNVYKGYRECVLKCTNSEHLFKFPTLEFQRKAWLERVGLTHAYFNTMICDKHFSEKMFSKNKKKLIKSAYPDINIPKADQPRLNIPKKLGDYRLVFEDHVCDVIELPEIICVLTVLKQSTEVDAPINGMKYIKRNTDANIPRREREVQVKPSELVKLINVGLSSDDLGDTEENIERDWNNAYEPHTYKTEMYECLECGEISVGYDCQRKHSNMHREGSSLCFQCGRKFPNQLKLRIHENRKHLKQIITALRCPKSNCNKAFHSQKQLHHHVEEHIRRPMYKCSRCTKEFTSALRLHSHQTACRNTWWIKHVKHSKRVSLRNRIK